MQNKDLSGIIDIHCHITPAVDDGAQTKMQVREMLKKEYADGVRGILLTPHYRKGMFESDTDLVRKRAAYVKYEVQQLGLDMQIFLGREYHANKDMVSELRQNPYFRINGGRYVLVEFSSMHSYEKIRNWLYQIITAGFVPIVAHVERYPDVMKDMRNVEDLIALGSLIQISTSAVLGEHGYRLKQYTKKMLQEHLVHFVASDAHDMDERRPNMKECYDYISKKFGNRYAGELFKENPKKILQGVD